MGGLIMDIDRLQRKDIDDAANDRITLAIDAISTMGSPYILDDVDGYKGSNWLLAGEKYVKYNIAEEDSLVFLYGPVRDLSEKNIICITVSFDYLLDEYVAPIVLDNISLIHDSVDFTITGLELNGEGHMDVNCSLFGIDNHVLNGIISGEGFGIGLNFKGNNSNAFVSIGNVKLVFEYDDDLQDEIDSIANRFIRGLCASVNDESISDDRNIYKSLKNLFHTKSIVNSLIPLFDVMDCVIDNFTQLAREDMLAIETQNIEGIIFDCVNYNGYPLKRCGSTNNILTNLAVSQISLNKEFTRFNNYTLEFDYYTSVNNRNGFYYGFDPGIASGNNLNASDDDYGVCVLVDIRKTLVETYYDGSTQLLYEHASNLLTAGTHNIRIVRRANQASIYVDDVLIYTHDNVQYNTLGLNKWQNSYNRISNVNITMDDNLDEYLFDIGDYYAQLTPQETNLSAGSTSSMSVTEDGELLISGYQTTVWHSHEFTQSNDYVLEMEVKKPTGSYVGKDFIIIIGEPSKHIKFNKAYYAEYLSYQLEENGADESVESSTTSTIFADYAKVRIIRKGNVWRCEFVSDGAVISSLEAAAPLDVPNKLGLCSFSGNNHSDELYVKNLRVTES